MAWTKLAVPFFQGVSVCPFILQGPGHSEGIIGTTHSLLDDWNALAEQLDKQNDSSCTHWIRQAECLVGPLPATSSLSAGQPTLLEVGQRDKATELSLL